MVCTQALRDPHVWGKDSHPLALAQLSQGKGADLFYTALKGDANREANCSSMRKCPKNWSAN